MRDVRRHAMERAALLGSGFFGSLIKGGNKLDIVFTFTMLFTGIIFVQFATVIHELGHAIPVLLFTKKAVIIMLGNADKKYSFKFGRVTFEFGRFAPVTGYLRCDSSSLPKVIRVLLTIGGPLASLCLGLAMLYLAKLYTDIKMSNMLLYFSYYSFYVFIVTAIPIMYPSWWGDYAGKPSDGYRLVNIFKA